MEGVFPEKMGYKEMKELVANWDGVSGAGEGFNWEETKFAVSAPNMGNVRFTMAAGELLEILLTRGLKINQAIRLFNSKGWHVTGNAVAAQAALCCRSAGQQGTQTRHTLVHGA